MLKLPFEARALLSPDERREITEHLSTHIGPKAIDGAVTATAIALLIARAGLDGSTTERSELYAEIRHHAECLRELMARIGDLERQAPWERMEELGVSSKLFDTLLEAVISTFPPVERPGRKGGRPRKAWRDRMIAMVFAGYPTGAAKKSHGSDFEETVAMLLRMLGEEVGDVHGAVVDALDRESPSIITVTAVQED